MSMNNFKTKTVLTTCNLCHQGLPALPPASTLALALALAWPPPQRPDTKSRQQFLSSFSPSDGSRTSDPSSAAKPSFYRRWHKGLFHPRILPLAEVGRKVDFQVFFIGSVLSRKFTPSMRDNFFRSMGAIEMKWDMRMNKMKDNRRSSLVV